MNRLAPLAFLVVLVACAAVIAGTLPELPDVVASHFGANGDVNGWAQRNIYGLVIFGAAIAVPALIVGIAMLPRFAPGIASRLINLPNRDYWLAAQRREVTLANLNAYACAFGAATALFVTALHLMTVHANLHPPPRLPLGPFIAMLAAYVGVVAVLSIAKLRHFRARG